MYNFPKKRLIFTKSYFYYNLDNIFENRELLI